tara:strand:+ start:289 stop:453 length:165 start_codon:yes stop_codon:yes gene_type:complete
MSEICPSCGAKRLRRLNGDYKCKKCRAETEEDGSVVDNFIKDYIAAEEEKEKDA